MSDPVLPDMGDAAPAAPPPTKGKPPSSPAVNPLSKIREAGDYDEQATIKGLLYGPTNGGKSTFLAKLPKPLIGLTEPQAIPSIRRANPKAAIFPISTYGDLLEFQAIVSSPKISSRYQSVGLDSLTDAQRIIREHYTNAQDKRTDVTDMDSWGVVIDKTARLVRTVRNAIGVSTWIVALDKEEVVGGIGLVHRPAVNGKTLPADLAQYVNVVGYMHREELPNGIRRTIRFDGGERFLTKGMGDLDRLEPPVPSWILYRAGLGPLPSPEDLEAVEEWKDAAKANS